LENYEEGEEEEEEIGRGPKMRWFVAHSHE
jgi:hypothetical protein